jgi:hypothetical protein
MLVVEALLHEAGRDLDLSVERDLERIQDRCKHEGISFLTITLPTLSDSLERGLESGTLTCPSNFARHGRLPRFLGGFFKRVFDKDGRLLPHVCPNTVYWIRQICRFFKKLKMNCTPSRELKAAKQFVEIEGELRRGTPLIEEQDDVLDQVSRVIWSRVFPEIDYSDLVCHHGPGVTADRYLSNERYRIRRWNHRSEYSFPSDLHCYPNYGYAAEASGRTEEGSEREKGPIELRIKEEIPVRIVFVPKTQSSPRVIAIEPSHMQYMQQSVKDYVYAVLERHPLTSRSIRFKDQSVNQRLAYESSVTKRLSTLDLKDASDRVHLHLVQRIFKNSSILPFLEDSRSLHATLPTGQNLVLFKFASMGSALCFPVEAMVFYTLVQSAMHKLDGIRPSSRSVRRYSALIDIYGDDIIVPVEYTDVVVRTLEDYLLKVNVNKSFTNSLFRESCGADYYNGFPVNPVYARKVPLDNVRQWGAEEVMSWNATADLFYLRGKWHVAQVIRDLLRQVVRRPIPRTQQLGSGIAHFSLLYTTDLRWNRDLQCYKQKRLHYDPVKRKDSIDGDDLACLNKWGILSHLGQTQVRDEHPDSDYSRVSSLAALARGNRDSGNAHSRDSECPRESGEWQVDERDSPFVSCDTYLDPEDAGEIPLQSSRLGSACGDMSGDISLNSTPAWPGSELFLLERELEKVQIDPLGYLTGSSVGYDFLTSTKRGGFKSKHRWVSLLS